MSVRHFFLRFSQTRDSDRFVLFHEGRLLTRGDDFLWSRQDIADLVDVEQHLHLVEEGEQALLALHASGPMARQLNADDRSLRGLLMASGGEVLPLAGKANQIVDWYVSHRFCGACATPTRPHGQHRALICPQCQRQYFPRINPCVIVLVVRGREVLLASHSRYQGEFFSCLAGFIEVGENAEQTIHRELMEEVGVRVENIRYIESQCWPFPSQLMLGYWADYLDGEITPDQEEIEEARWFDVDSLPRHPGSGISVAGELIARYRQYVQRNNL